MAQNDSRVNIDALTIYMTKKLQGSTSPKFRKQYIYRVNQKFQKINPSAYTPGMVSIGPFHHKQGSLRAMEAHKLHCVKTFFPTVSSTQESRVKECIAHMATLLEDTRDCYESFKLDNNAFLEIMMLDGFFIIDLFQKYARQKSELRQEDPLLNNLWSIASLKRDILLLENQLPMSVLVNLLMFIKRRSDGSSSSVDVMLKWAASYATKLSLRFFDGLIMPMPYNLESYGNLEGKHLLDLLGKTLYPSSLDPSSRYPKTWKSVPCVTELTQAGVKFKRGSLTRLLDIQYNNGTIEIPPIVIHDLSETLFRNLIAYEQCSHQQHNYLIISYVFFMDSLINSEEDVRILCEEKIMENNLGNNKAVCDIFNTLCNEATLENFYYYDTCWEVNTYYNLFCKRSIATLKRDYFGNPWTILSFLAAVLLLLLTITQTITSILQVTDNKTTDIDFGTSASKLLIKLLDKNSTTN